MPGILLLVLLGVQLLWGGTISSAATPDPRLALEQAAVVEAGILLVCFCLLIARELSSSRPATSRRALGPLLHFSLWVFNLCFLATAIGLAVSNPEGYILGDFFRFLWPAGVMIAAYWTIVQEPNHSQAAPRMLYGAMLVALACLLFDLGHYFIYQGLQDRFWSDSVQMCPWILVIAAYLKMKKPNARRGLVYSIAVVAVVVALVVSQTRTLLGLGALGLVWTIRTHPSRKLRRQLLAAALIVSACGVMLIPLTARGRALAFSIRTRFSLTLSQLSPNQQYGETYYRWLEARQVVDRLRAHPVEWLFGDGFGSYIEVEAALTRDGRFVYGWGTMHYIHDAYLEILFRTGLLGLVIELGLFLWVWRCIEHGSAPAERWLVRVSMVLFLTGLFFFDSVFENTLLFYILAVLLAQCEHPTLLALPCPVQPTLSASAPALAQ